MTLGDSEAMHTKVCKLSLTSYVYFLHHARAIQILFDCELHKLILQINKMALAAKQDGTARKKLCVILSVLCFKKLNEARFEVSSEVFDVLDF